MTSSRPEPELDDKLIVCLSFSILPGGTPRRGILVASSPGSRLFRASLSFTSRWGNCPVFVPLSFEIGVRFLRLASWRWLKRRFARFCERNVHSRNYAHKVRTYRRCLWKLKSSCTCMEHRQNRFKRARTIVPRFPIFSQLKSAQ